MNDCKCLFGDWMEKSISPETGGVAQADNLHPAGKSWISVVRAYNLCSAAILRGIAPSGMNLTQHEVLINLLLRPGLSQQELAARCFSAKSGISAIVNAFEKDGVLTRMTDAHDARKKELFLTDEGRTRAAFNLSIQNEVISSMVGPYSKSELDDLEEKMNGVSEILKEMFVE